MTTYPTQGEHAQPEALRQILLDPENQPNQHGVQFLMHGRKMAFKIGARQFTLDYEPDEPGEFEFMRDALIDAFSVFTPDVKTSQPAAPQGGAYAELPEHLTLAVDRWFAENTGLGGCSDKDVRELAALFYGVHHAGGRESVDDALAIVESLGPGIGGLNDTYARQILLAEEVKRLRASHGQAPAQAAPAAVAGPSEFPHEQMDADLHFHDSRADALTRLSRRMDVMRLSRVSGHRDLRQLLQAYYRESAADIAASL